MIANNIERTRERKSRKLERVYPHISLETMLLKEVTEVTSQRFFQKCSGKFTGFGSFVQMHWDRLFWPKEVVMLFGPDEAVSLRERVPADATLGGVYGINVDEQNQVWFSKNHGSLIHKFDEQFNLVKQYRPHHEGRLYQLIHNYKGIAFNERKGYVLDAGLQGSIAIGYPSDVCLQPAVHVFAMPEFKYEHSFYFDLPALYSAKTLGFMKQEIWVGSRLNTNTPQRYRIDNVLSEKNTKLMEVEDLVTICLSQRECYGFLEKEEEGKDFSGETKKYLIALGKENVQPVKSIHFPAMEYIDRGIPIIANQQDTFFCMTRLYEEHSEGMQQFWNAVGKNGEIVGRVALSQETTIRTLCFDREDKLVVLFEREISGFGKRLFLGKYAFSY